MLVRRDPFAREELHRETVTGRSVDVVGGFGDRLYTCDWCGTVKRTKSGKPTAYRYSTETDGGRRFTHKGTFCSKSCHDTYHA